MQERVMRLPKPFFRYHDGIAVDELGGFWIVTRLRTPGDSTRIDYLPAENRKPHALIVRDEVVGIAISDGRLAAVVKRLGPGALGRHGLDIYRIERSASEDGGR